LTGPEAGTEATGSNLAGSIESGRATPHPAALLAELLKLSSLRAKVLYFSYLFIF